MNNFILGLSLCALLNVPVSGFAQTVNDFYRVEVAVNGRGQATRTQALQTALGNLLVKLSGQKKFLQQPEIKQQLSQAAKLVQSYVYESRPSAQGSLPRSVLVVNFHPNDVNAFMQRVGVPNWGENRPLVLAWVNIKPKGWVSEEYNPNAAQLLSHAAKRRGLPLLLPLLDLEDLQQISGKTMLDLEREEALQSAERYKPDVVLFAQLNQQNNRWSSVWKAYTQTDFFSWEGQEASLQASLTTGIGHLTEQLAAQTQQANLATLPLETVTVHIDNVQSYQDYGRLVNYLKGLGVVQTIEPLQTSSTEIILQLQVRGGAKGLQQVTQLSRLLSEFEKAEKPEAKNIWGEPVVTEEQENNKHLMTLHYKYQP